MLRTFVVTSAPPAEAKTTVAVCLALRMAAAGKRTLLIDADLRRPTVHRLLGIDNAQGVMPLGQRRIGRGEHRSGRRPCGAAAGRGGDARGADEWTHPAECDGRAADDVVQSVVA